MSASDLNSAGIEGPILAHPDPYPDRAQSSPAPATTPNTELVHNTRILQRMMLTAMVISFIMFPITLWYVLKFARHKLNRKNTVNRNLWSVMVYCAFNTALAGCSLSLFVLEDVSQRPLGTCNYPAYVMYGISDVTNPLAIVLNVLVGIVRTQTLSGIILTQPQRRVFKTLWWVTIACVVVTTAIDIPGATPIALREGSCSWAFWYIMLHNSALTVCDLCNTIGSILIIRQTEWLLYTHTSVLRDVDKSSEFLASSAMRMLDSLTMERPEEREELTSEDEREVQRQIGRHRWSLWTKDPSKVKRKPSVASSAAGVGKTSKTSIGSRLISPNSSNPYAPQGETFEMSRASTSWPSAASASVTSSARSATSTGHAKHIQSHSHLKLLSRKIPRPRPPNPKADYRLRFLRFIILNAVVSALIYKPLLIVEFYRGFNTGFTVLGVFFVLQSLTYGTDNVVTVYCIYHMVMRRESEHDSGPPAQRTGRTTACTESGSKEPPSYAAVVPVGSKPRHGRGWRPSLPNLYAGGGVPHGVSIGSSKPRSPASPIAIATSPEDHIDPDFGGRGAMTRYSSRGSYISKPGAGGGAGGLSQPGTPTASFNMGGEDLKDVKDLPAPAPTERRPSATGKMKGPQPPVRFSSLEDDDLHIDPPPPRPANPPVTTGASPATPTTVTTLIPPQPHVPLPANAGRDLPDASTDSFFTARTPANSATSLVRSQTSGTGTGTAGSSVASFGPASDAGSSTTVTPSAVQGGRRGQREWADMFSRVQRGVGRGGSPYRSSEGRWSAALPVNNAATSNSGTGKGGSAALQASAWPKGPPGPPMPPGQGLA